MIKDPRSNKGIFHGSEVGCTCLQELFFLHEWTHVQVVCLHTVIFDLSGWTVTSVQANQEKELEEFSWSLFMSHF